MNKNKKVSHSKKEEAQANRVIKMVFISLIILALIMLVGFSVWG